MFFFCIKYHLLVIPDMIKMQVCVAWWHDHCITLQVFNAVLGATSEIGEIIKSLCTSDKGRNHDSLPTIQSLLQVCTYRSMYNPKIKVCLQKIELHVYNAYTDVHCFKIISSNSLIIMLLYHVLRTHVWHQNPQLTCFQKYQGFIHEAL